MVNMLYEKWLRLMADLVDLEKWVEVLEEEKEFFEESETPEYAKLVAQELHRQRELLAEKRGELARLGTCYRTSLVA